MTRTKGVFSMLIGVPGSGKSRFGQSLDGVVVSSDAIRGELYGSEAEQKDPWRVFSVMHERAIDYLQEGKTVIYDATNILAAHRRKTLEAVSGYSERSIGYFIDVPIEVALERNKKRARVVEDEVIHWMYQELELPQLDEGFDEIWVLDADFEVKQKLFNKDS